MNQLRAWAAILKLSDGDDRNRVLVAGCQGITKTAPAVALETAQVLKLGSKSGTVMQDLIQQLATSDFLSALDWANNQLNGDQCNGLTRRIAFVLKPRC